MDELKACPFCGKPFVIIRSQTGGFMLKHTVENCPIYANGKTGPTYRVKKYLIDELNTRPLEDAQQAEIERLREAQRWIPVGERMPEFELGTASKYVEVAYRIPGSPNYLRGDVQYWEKYGWVFKWENGKAETFDDYGYIVEFWKPLFPLPQPPQEAEG